MFRAFRHFSSHLNFWHRRTSLYSPSMCGAGHSDQAHGSRGCLYGNVDTFGCRRRGVDRIRICLSRPRRDLRQRLLRAGGGVRSVGRRPKSEGSSARDRAFLGRQRLRGRSVSFRNLAPLAMDSRHDRGRRCRRDLSPPDGGDPSVQRFDGRLRRELGTCVIHRSGLGTVRCLDSSASGIPAGGRDDPVDARHLDPGLSPSAARTGSRWVSRACRRIRYVTARVVGAKEARVSLGAFRLQTCRVNLKTASSCVA